MNRPALSVQDLVRMASAQGYPAEEVYALCATPLSIRAELFKAVLPACVTAVPPSSKSIQKIVQLAKSLVDEALPVVSTLG